jgi:hypothetical protein
MHIIAWNFISEFEYFILKTPRTPLFLLLVSLSLLLLFIKDRMVKTTIIARVSDGLPLAASMDDEQVGVHKGRRKEMMN